MQTALVTGANRGLGFTFVKQLREQDMQVIACCRHPKQATALQDLANTLGHITIQPLDLTQQNQIDQLAAQLTKQPIDLLVNNAGIIGQTGVTIGNVDRDNFLNVIDVNCLGTLKLSEALLPQLQLSQDPLILIMSSSMSSISDNRRGRSYAYRASKVALNCVMRSFAIDVEPLGIKVMLMNPGWVKTDMGGENALISSDTSVHHILQQVAQHRADAHATVLRCFDGGTLAW